jgi:hypothetical protein
MITNTRSDLSKSQAKNNLWPHDLTDTQILDKNHPTDTENFTLCNLENYKRFAHTS